MCRHTEDRRKRCDVCRRGFQQACSDVSAAYAQSYRTWRDPRPKKASGKEADRLAEGDRLLRTGSLERFDSAAARWT